MSQASQIVIGVRDKAAEVALRRQLLEKERELKLQAKLREQDNKLKRVEEQKVAELQRKSKLRAQKDLEKSKAVLDRKQAQLEADKNRKAEILQRAHQAASRTAQTSPSKVYAFGSSTPRELTYFERIARDQRTPTRVGTTTTTPKKSPVPSDMTTSYYVPRVAAVRSSEFKPISVTPMATRRSPTVNAAVSKTNVDHMSASMYTPSKAGGRRSLALARVKHEEQKKATTPLLPKSVPVTRRALLPRSTATKTKDSTPIKNPVIAALSVPKKILPKRAVEQKTAEVLVEKAADSLSTKQVPTIEAGINTKVEHQEVPNVAEEVFVQELHQLKLSDCSTPEPNDVIEPHDSGIDDVLSTKADVSEETTVIQIEGTFVKAEAIPIEAVHQKEHDILGCEEQYHEETDAAPVQTEVQQEVKVLSAPENAHQAVSTVPAPEEAHEEVFEKTLVEPQVAESAFFVSEVNEELVESKPKLVSEFVDSGEHVSQIVENSIHNLETDRPSKVIKDGAAFDNFNEVNTTLKADSELVDEHHEPQITNMFPSAPLVNLNFVESSIPLVQEYLNAPDSEAPVDPAIAPITGKPLVDLDEPAKPIIDQPTLLLENLTEDTPKIIESVTTVETFINGVAQTNGRRTASPDSSASSTKGSSDAENVPVSEPESRSDMKARLNALMSRVRDPNVSPPFAAKPKSVVDGRALALALLEQRRNGNGVSPTSVLTNLTLGEEMAVAEERTQHQCNKSVMDILPGQVYDDDHAAGKRTPPEDPAHAVV